MRATALLCDHVEVADGKLFINGGGWDQIPAGGLPTGLALLVHVPWDETNQKKNLVVELIDEDGSPVLQQGPAGGEPVRLEIGFEVGRPPGTSRGSEFVMPLAMNFPPLLLAQNSSFVWQVQVNGGEVIARVTFHTR